MAAYAGRRLHGMAENLARLVAIELLCAAQGIDFRRPLRSSEALERAHARIRQLSPRLEDDRPLGPDIERVAAAVLAGELRP